MTIKEVNDKLKNPSKTQILQRAKRLEESLRFHTDTNTTERYVPRASADFLSWVKSLLPYDKYEVFKKLYRFPLYTPSLVEEIYSELSRVFDSQNFNSSYVFSDLTLAEDWQSYQLERLKSSIFWKTEAWAKMKTEPNSILVVDMPRQQTGRLPEPYVYWLGVDDIIDYAVEVDSHALSWLLFKQPDQKIAYMDKEQVCVFASDEYYTEVISIEHEAFHDLGYCPAQFFWSELLNTKEPELRKNPILKELSNLDWLLFYTISKKHLDLYAAYPIYSSYEASCDFVDSETHAYCDHGFLRDESGNYMTLRDGSVEACPICRNNNIVGPGTLIEVPAPDRETGDMRNPVQITTVDTNSLKYNVDECVRLEELIKTKVIGRQDDMQKSEAVNTMQVQAGFESKKSVLNKLKLNFEQAQAFVETTVCKMRYGSDFMGLDINYGTEFHISSVQDLYDKYRTAKDNGASIGELDALQDQILEAEYRDNPVVLRRIQILKQLEPFRHLTTDEVLDLYKEGVIAREDLMLKLNLNMYVDRFERENINIVDFGQAITLTDKINNIKLALYEYIRQEPRNSKASTSNKSGAGKNGDS